MNKNIIISSFIFTSFLSTITTKPVNAAIICFPWETNCVVDGIPDWMKKDGSNGQSSRESCIATFSRPSYFKYVIENASNTTVKFKIRNEIFKLDPGESRSYQSQTGSGGSNSCNRTYYGMPTITFDSNFADGYQPKGYTLNSDVKKYIFRNFGNELDLFGE